MPNKPTPQCRRAEPNRQSVERTLREQKVCFWSRSRQKYWVKGETSGHFQLVQGVYIDCDKDTLLIKAKQVGAACHEGYRTCFFREITRLIYDSPTKLYLYGSAFSAYAAINGVEAVGLWREKRWAEYLTLVITASFLPLEAFEIYRKLTLFRVGLLAVNALIFIYLLMLVISRGKRKGITGSSPPKE